jgi:lambda repressor-like predicted transcriptional regulator
VKKFEDTVFGKTLIASGGEVDDGTLRSRLKAGWSYEDAISEPKNSGVTLRARKGQTLKARCERAGISYCAVRERIKKGWSEEEALSIPQRGKRETKTTSS